MSEAPLSTFVNTNTHILVHDFDYYEAATINEATQLLDRLGGDAQVMLGGTNLITNMKMERAHPHAIISLNKIPGIMDIKHNDDGSIAIGAGVKIFTLKQHPFIRTHYRALAEACAAFGNTQIQIMGTVGGNICNGSPASDSVPPLMALGAILVLEGKQGERRVTLEDFLKGPGKVDLRKGELLREIILPPPPGTSLFIKVSRVGADLSKASLAVWIVRDGDLVKDCRLAFGSVAPMVIRLQRVESMLVGKKFDPGKIAEIAQAASEDISPIDDVRSKAWYRRQLAKAMTTDALNEAWKQSSEKVDRVPFKAEAAPTLSAPRQVPAGESREISLSVNGHHYKLDLRSNDLLLNVLRDRLDLRGAKYGCGLGECGACTVLMDGKATLSCLVLAVAAEGHEITTVEGLQSPDGTLDPIQEMFIDEAAFQCGYCTSGFLMATKSLLNEIPKPDEDTIRDYLKGNRCRCTGYASIIRATMRAAEQDNKVVQK